MPAATLRACVGDGDEEAVLDGPVDNAFEHAAPLMVMVVLVTLVALPRKPSSRLVSSQHLGGRGAQVALGVDQELRGHNDGFAGYERPAGDLLHAFRRQPQARPRGVRTRRLPWPRSPRPVRRCAVRPPQVPAPRPRHLRRAARRRRTSLVEARDPRCPLRPKAVNARVSGSTAERKNRIRPLHLPPGKGVDLDGGFASLAHVAQVRLEELRLGPERGMVGDLEHRHAGFARRMPSRESPIFSTTNPEAGEKNRIVRGAEPARSKRVDLLLGDVPVMEPLARGFEERPWRARWRRGRHRSASSCLHIGHRREVFALGRDQLRAVDVEEDISRLATDSPTLLTWAVSIQPSNLVLTETSFSSLWASTPTVRIATGSAPRSTTAVRTAKFCWKL